MRFVTLEREEEESLVIQLSSLAAAAALWATAASKPNARPKTELGLIMGVSLKVITLPP